MRRPIFALLIIGILGSGCNRCDDAQEPPTESTLGISDLQGRVVGFIQEGDPSMLHVSLLIPDESEIPESRFIVTLSEAETQDKPFAVAIERPMKVGLEGLGITASENYAHIRVEVINRSGDNTDGRSSKPVSSPFSDPVGAPPVPNKFALNDPGRYLLTFTKMDGGSPVAVFEFGIIDDSKGLAGGFYFVSSANDRLPRRDQ